MNTDGSQRMNFTGERYIPSVKGNIELEHRHRYLLARELCQGKDVLDLASGEGYGSAMLSGVANSVVGVDIAWDAVHHCQRTYVRQNLRFMEGSCAEIPLPNASIDVVVSFETLEHHDQHDEMMAEVKRVLRPDGLLIISTPDKHRYSVVPGKKNEFHVKELFHHEFVRLLRKHFINASFYGQRVIFGSFVVGEGLNLKVMKLSGEGETVARADEMIDPMYWIGLASDAALPMFGSGFLEQAIEDSEAEQARAERDAFQHERDVILASTFWRLTKPARLVATRMPASLRLHVRRISKLLYWILTPQQTLQRISFLKARCQRAQTEPRGPGHTHSNDVAGGNCGGQTRRPTDLRPGAHHPVNITAMERQPRLVDPSACSIFSSFDTAGEEMETFGIQMQALAERYYGSDANRKPAIYLAEYERLFGPMRNAPLRLLELGVRFGASMLLWSDYFPNATIVGLDIADRPEAFPAEKRIHFVQGSQDDPAVLDKCASVAGGQFDIIIDDASHVGRLSASSFAHLFPRALKPGGFYVIEDICTAFLPEFPDSEPFVPPEIGRQQDARRFPSHQAGMVGVVKQLFDHVMAPVAQGSSSRYPIERMLVLTNIAIMQKGV